MSDDTDWKNKPESFWKEKLTPLQFAVSREAGTERAFGNEYWDNHQEGIYACVCCGAELFDSKTKFESGTGWPSFYDLIKQDRIETKEDNGFLMNRTEVLCKRCDAHLGHLFDDGPEPTGLRYCMNSSALQFKKKDK